GFTQIDLEMSFPTRERVFAVVEGFLGAAFEAAGVKIPVPFPRMSYDDAMRQYGSDKPDLRLPPMVDVRSAFAPEELEKLGIGGDVPVMAIRIPAVGELSRKERDETKPLFAGLKPANAKLFEDFKRLEKSFPEMSAKIRTLLAQHDEKDLIVLVAGAATPAEHKSEGGVKPEVKQP